MTLRSVELRSDTFTRPTPAMRRAMFEAEVGDDVWDEDPTVHALERRAAELTGKEGALFVSSGTQGNLIGVLAHSQRGDEVILGDESHIFRYEVAGTAVIGGVQLRTIHTGADGSLDPGEVRSALREDDIHQPRTGVVALENTHQRRGGVPLTREQTASVADIAHGAGARVHLDGARLFNAVVALETSAAELTAPVDSVTFCLSKGLGAPVGSMLCGDADFIRRARRWRKMLGGGMRQVGILAAAGLVALDAHIERLAEDHANARRLAEGLAAIPGLVVDPSGVRTNIVFFDVAIPGVDAAAFADRLETLGVRVAPMGETLRAVTSYEVSREDIDYAVEAAAMAVREPAPALG